MFPHPSLYTGEFNCQQVNWSYRATFDGERLASWAPANNLKKVASFFSHRWNVDTIRIWSSRLTEPIRLYFSRIRNRIKISDTKRFTRFFEDSGSEILLVTFDLLKIGAYCTIAYLLSSEPSFQLSVPHLLVSILWWKQGTVFRAGAQVHVRKTTFFH